MMAYDPDTNDKYCDLQCMACPGYVNVPCLLNSQGLTMRTMSLSCMASGQLLSQYKPSSKHWRKYAVKELQEAGYPIYTGEREH
jgi:hypothetical protein